MVTEIVDLYGHKISTSQMQMGKGKTSPYCVPFVIQQLHLSSKILGCQPFDIFGLKILLKKQQQHAMRTQAGKWLKPFVIFGLKKLTKITAKTCHENSTWWMTGDCSGSMIIWNIRSGRNTLRNPWGYRATKCWWTCICKAIAKGYLHPKFSATNFKILQSQMLDSGLQFTNDDWVDATGKFRIGLKLSQLISVLVVAHLMQEIETHCT